MIIGVMALLQLAALSPDARSQDKQELSTTAAKSSAAPNASRTSPKLSVVKKCCGPVRPLVRAIPGMVLGGSFPDKCRKLEGYEVFRSRLTAAVAARDEASFRALFGKEGYMRMDGVGGGAQMPPSETNNSFTDEIWEDLDQILTLGCAVENDGLLLPFTTQAPENLKALGQMVAVRSTAVRSAPKDNARILTIAPRGAVLVQLKYPAKPADDWEYFTLTNGRSGFVRAKDLRSPVDSALQVAREGADWRIVYYGGYD